MTFRERWERFKVEVTEEFTGLRRDLKEDSEVRKKERRKPHSFTRFALWFSILFWGLWAIALLPVFFTASIVMAVMCYVVYHMYLRRGH